MGASDDIADLIERVFDGDPWHASSVADLLSDVTAAEAVARPVPGGHSIWELVLHMTGWASEVRARLDGQEAGEPEGGDWPEVAAPTEARWRAAVAGLEAAHRELAAAVRASDPGQLRKPVLDRREPALGTGLSKELTVHGLIHHTVYHAGQIAQVKRAVRHGS